MATMTHPDLPDREIEVPDETVEVHALSGWVVKSMDAAPPVPPAFPGRDRGDD